MTGKRVDEIKFLKKGGREKNRYEHTVVKDETEYSFAFVGEPIFPEFGSIRRVDPLEGRTIRFLEYSAGWQKTMQGAAPNKAQQKKNWLSASPGKPARIYFQKKRLRWEPSGKRRVDRSSESSLERTGYQNPES